MVGRAETRGEENEIAVLAQDLLLPFFPGFLEAGMQQIEARIAGDVIAADLFQKTFQVLLLSFAPQEQIVDVLQCLVEDAARDVIFAGPIGEALLAHDCEHMPSAADRAELGEATRGQPLLQDDARRERGGRFAEPALFDEPDIMTAAYKLAAEKHARGQFPFEHLYQEDEVLWRLRHCRRD